MHIRNSQLTDLILRAVRKAQIPAVDELLGLTREDGKRPDGATLIPWAQGNPLAWNVTVPDTYAPSHLQNTSLTAGAAADKAAVSKTAKYDKLRGTHLFFPVAIETGGSWNTLVLPCSKRDGRTVKHTCSSLWQSERENHGTHRRRNLFKKSEED